jgi:small subunit ribosomal protein S18
VSDRIDIDEEDQEGGPIRREHGTEASEAEEPTSPDLAAEEGAGPGRTRRYSQISEKNRCRFCREKVQRIDYKDIGTLQKLCTSQGRLFSRKRSGNCAGHQRMVKKAVKQSRFIGLLPYVG